MCPHCRKPIGVSNQETEVATFHPIHLLRKFPDAPPPGSDVYLYHVAKMYEIFFKLKIFFSRIMKR